MQLALSRMTAETEQRRARESQQVLIIQLLNDYIYPRPPGNLFPAWTAIQNGVLKFVIICAWFVLQVLSTSEYEAQISRLHSKVESQTTDFAAQHIQWEEASMLLTKQAEHAETNVGKLRESLSTTEAQLARSKPSRCCGIGPILFLIR